MWYDGSVRSYGVSPRILLLRTRESSDVRHSDLFLPDFSLLSGFSVSRYAKVLVMERMCGLKLEYEVNVYRKGIGFGLVFSVRVCKELRELDKDSPWVGELS